MGTALAYAVQLLGILPSVLDAGKNIKDLLIQGNAALDAMQKEKRDPTPAEWAALNKTISALRADLHS